MALDIVALGISGIALLVSGLGYFGTRSTRRREWRIEAGKIAAETGLTLSGIQGQGRRVKASWHALFAANGTFHSSMREGRDAEIETHIDLAEALKGQFGTARSGLTRLSDGELEQRILQLRSIQLQAQNVADWMNGKEQDHKDAVRARRSNIEGS